MLFPVAAPPICADRCFLIFWGSVWTFVPCHFFPITGRFVHGMLVKLVPKRSLQELALAVYNASSQKRAGTYSSEPLSKFMREYLRAYRTSSKFALRKLTAMVVHGGHRRQAKREWFARTLQLPDTVPQYENAWTKDDCRTILLAVAERDPSSAKLPDI